jgi:Ca2+-binding EF-hand superfamily protein
MEGKPEENKVSGVQFVFTNDDKKHLSPQEQSAFIRAFNNYDKNQDGTMDDSEFKNIMIDLGYRKITDADVTKMLGD